MPNSWSKAIQSLNEKFQGPRTNDSEIKLKLEKAETIDKSLKNLKNIISNFSTYFEKILSYNREISECIFILFDNNQEFKELAEILTQVHVENNKLFSNITNEIVQLTRKTNEWPNYFNGLKMMDVHREEARKVYDHYEKKLEKLNGEKSQRIKKGNFQENSNFAKKLERNEEKFVNSKKNYIDHCIELYDKVDNLLSDRFNIINPVLLKLFFVEMKIYESFNSKFNTYKNLEEKFNQMKSNFEKRVRFNDYDPQKFMKNPKIEENFENRKYAMVEYRKSVYARSKSQVKSSVNSNQVNYQQKFHQVSNLDDNPSRKINNNSKNDGFFFENDNAANDFNKIDNNFSNFNIKSKNNQNKTNMKIPNSNEINKNDFQFEISQNLSNKNGINPVSVKENQSNKSANNSSFNINNDFNEIFGNFPSNNQNSNMNDFSNNNNNHNYNIFGNANSNLNAMNTNQANNGYEFNYEANVIQETQIDFGFNSLANNNQNINSFNFYNQGQLFNNQMTMNFNQNPIINNIQANPGDYNQNIFNQVPQSSINERNSYPTLNNVLENPSNFNQKNNNFNIVNQTNLVPIISNNLDLNNFNSGVNFGNSPTKNQKRSGSILLKRKNEDFENILNSNKNVQKNPNKESDPFEGYY